MAVIIIVIANEALKCYGIRYCEPMSSVELVRLWQLGLVEVMSETVLGGVLLKVYRRLRDKINLGEDRMDKIFPPKELGK